MNDRLLNDDDLGLFFLVHRAIREDLEALPRAVERLRPDERNEAFAMARWFVFLASTIEKHHRGEDDWLYPRLVPRDPRFAAARDALAREHQALDPALAAVAEGFEALGRSTDFAHARAALVARIAALRDAMREHLDREESALVPSMKLHITKKEVEEFERAGARETSFGELSLVIPWVFDVADARERAQLDAVLPWPVKLLYRWSWRQSYERLVRPVRARARQQEAA